MARRVILAVAGAGKTYRLCHSINPSKRNLILAYTKENVHNIQRELLDAYGAIPSGTKVSTFDSFVYHEIVLPYEPSIVIHYDHPEFSGKGITMQSPPPQTIQHGRSFIKNPSYIKKDRLGHYVNLRGHYYCANLSELVMSLGLGKQSLVSRVSARLNRFYDSVFIDEFQDFREHDYDLIIALSKKLNDVLFVGDYYYHSVSAVNNAGKPFSKKGKKTISYSEYVKELQGLGFEVDTTSLNQSRRCPAEICDFVSEKLHIDISSCAGHRGSVVWLNEVQAKAVLQNDEILKLVYKESSSYPFRSMNWSYSKGDTVDESCVILTARLEGLDLTDFSPEEMPRQTLNKLYVALTRSRKTLFLIKPSVFSEIKVELFDAI